MSGYDPEFLGEQFKIDIPWIHYDVFVDVLKRDELRKNYIADYLHYSLVMSKKNRQAYLSICNLDQTQYRSVSSWNWFIDPRIGGENQLDNRYYKGWPPVVCGRVTTSLHLRVSVKSADHLSTRLILQVFPGNVPDWLGESDQLTPKNRSDGPSSACVSL